MNKLTVGMLWFDSDKSRSLTARLERAADYYREKYGAEPNLCLIHPGAVGEECPAQVNGVTVEASESVLPEHLWLGVAAPGEAAAVA